MIKVQMLWHGAAWLAICGMCLPASVVVGNEPHATTGTATAMRQSPAAIHDVALRPGGLLVGQIVDETMQPMRGVPLAIQIDGKTAATTSTDANGVFAVAGLRGGMHQVVTGDTTKICRLWSPGTAPPRAVSHLRFVPGQADVVRGQWGPPPSYDTMLGWATNPWVIGGVVVAAVGVPVLLNNLDDDDDDNGS